MNTLPSDLRTHRLVEKVHDLGPKPLFYMLREIANGADVARTLAAYADLPADFICALGGDRFTTPLRIVDGGRPDNFGGRS